MNGDDFMYLFGGVVIVLLVVMMLTDVTRIIALIGAG